jgi:type IV pilus assembly protein PilQ
MAYLIIKQSKRFMLLLIAALVAAVPAGCATKASVQPEASYQETETAPDLALITDIRVLEKNQGTIVEISGDRMLTFTSVKQFDPSGILLYFPNTGLDVDTSQLAVAGVITGIDSSELSTDTATVRVAIHLAEDCAYTVNKDENRLEVIFPSTETAAVPSEPEPVMQAAVEPSEPSLEMEAPAATMVSDISAANEETYTDIRILADGAITDYSTFELSNPPRIVYDLKNIQGANTSEQTVKISNGSLDQVRYYTHPDKIRLVIDATSDHLTHNAISTENGLSIQVENGLKAAAKAPVYVAQANQASDAIEAPAATGPIGLVNKIDFTGETDGKSTILIGATETPKYTLEKIGDTKLKLTLFQTKLPDYRERPIITTGFESAVDRILPYTQENTPNQTFFTIELRESVPYYVEQQGSRLMVHFDASSIPAKAPAAELTLADRQVTVSQSTTAPKTTVVSQSSPRTTAASTATQTAAEPEETVAVAATPKYTGEKISLDFYETDIKNVFRILREVSGMNFAIDKDVTGTVNLSLDKPVPWDQVLDLILKQNQLGKTMEGDIVRIATQETLRNEESARQEAILAVQKSKEQELALEPIRTEYIPVNYSSAGSEVLPHIENILSEGRGHAEVDERSNLIVITDTDRVITQAKAIVEQLDKVTPQVMIEARVVEVNSNFSHELGISWDLAQEGVVKNMLGGTYDWDMAMNYPASDTTGTVGFSFSRVAGTPLVIDATLNAMQSQSKGKIVSAPKILTKDNITASIKQGYEVGYTERDDSGGSSISFKSVDLLLEVTPHVTPDSRVSMTVHITKNDIGDEYNDMPLLNTNEANTEFLVENGETVVIGGILKSTETTSHKGFPILKDIPGLGLLFGNQSESTVSKELLIFITPKIVTLTQKSVD